jgi:hypothetical protein
MFPLDTHASVGTAWQVSTVTTAGIDDLYFVTTVTLENVGDNILFDVQYLRGLTPRQEYVRATLRLHMALCTYRMVVMSFQDCQSVSHDLVPLESGSPLYVCATA